MASLNTKFKKIINDLESNIKDEKTLADVKLQVFELYNIFFEEFNRMEELANSRVAEIMQNQQEMLKRLQALESNLKDIKKDIYLEDEQEIEDYDFTIVCPYCNNELKLDGNRLEGEIECPECKNIIELDWDTGCNCDECSHDCHKDDDEDM